MRCLKLSKTALTAIIIQTILTLGLNWLAFLIFYRIWKYSYLSLNEESNDYNNFYLFFKHKMDTLSIISIIIYLIYLLCFTIGIFIIVDPKFFYYINFALASYLKSNILSAVIIAIILGMGVTYSYNVLIKNVFYTIYKHTNQHFNNFTQFDFYLFIFFSIISLGTYFLTYLIILGLYDLYLSWLNKIVNKKSYVFSKYGIVSLFLIGYLFIVLLYYISINNVYLNKTTIYVHIIMFLNVFLNYGFFELRYRLFSDNNLTIFEQTGDYSLNAFFNQRLVVFSFFIVIITTVISVGRMNNFKEQRISYPALTKINTYEEIGDIKLCYPSTYNQGNSRYNLWIEPISATQEYNYHRRLITSFINPEQLNEPQVINIGYSYIDIFYTTEGEYYSYNNGFIHVQTFYKKMDDCFVPIFNIVKNMSLVASLDNFTLHLSIMNNNVYYYDFYMDKLSLITGKYRNIDTTRLMIDDLAIKVIAPQNTLYGYNIKDDTTYLDVDSDNIRNLETFVTLFDYVPVNEMIPSLFKAFRQLDEKEVMHLTDIDLLTFRLFKNTEHISYYNDRYFLYMSTVGLARNINESYINTPEGLIKCADTRCKNISDISYTNELNIINLTEQSRMLYTDLLLYNDDFKMIDQKIITIFDNSSSFDEIVEIQFTVKTIKQYFYKEVIAEETLKISE